MRLKTTYQEVLKRYPQQVAEILKKKDESSSKSKDMKPSDMRWEFDWCVCIGSNGHNIPSTIVSVCLVGKAGHGRWYAGLLETPHEITDLYDKQKEEEKKEKERISKLTPEERNRETQKILKQLRGMPGFWEINIHGK